MINYFFMFWLLLLALRLFPSCQYDYTPNWLYCFCLCQCFHWSSSKEGQAALVICAWLLDIRWGRICLNAPFIILVFITVMNRPACAHLACAHLACAHVSAQEWRACQRARVARMYARKSGALCIVSEWHIRSQNYVWIKFFCVHYCHERASMRAPFLRACLQVPRLCLNTIRSVRLLLSVFINCHERTSMRAPGLRACLRARAARMALLAPHQVGRFCLSRFFLLYFFVNLFSLVAKRGQHARTFFARAHQVTRLFWTMFLYLYPYKCMCSQ